MNDGSTDPDGADEGEEDEESVDETLDQLADTVDDAVAEGETEDGTDDTTDDADTGENDGADGTDSGTPADGIDESGSDADEADPTTDADAEIDATDAEIDALVARAVEDVESLVAGFTGEESIEGAKADVEDLIEVGEEAVELLESIDPGALAGAVDPEELPNAIDLEDVPEAVAETDPGEAIKYRKLLDVIELGEVWNEMDVREVWENKREFDDEIEDVTGGGSEENGPLAAFRDVLDRFTDDDDGEASSESDEDDGGIFGDDDATEEGGAGDATSGHADNGDREDVEVPSEVMQQRIQSGLDDAVTEFRESLLEVRDQLEAKKAENAERVEDLEQPVSRNPTAYSTLSTAGRDTHEVAKHSTVPGETKYSTAPNRERLYGSRLDRAGGNEDE